MPDRRSRSADPSFGLSWLSLGEEDKLQSPSHLYHSGSHEEDAPSEQGGREAPRPPTAEEIERQRQLESRPWYPRGGGVSQGPYVQDIPYLPESATSQPVPTSSTSSGRLTPATQLNPSPLFPPSVQHGLDPRFLPPLPPQPSTSASIPSFGEAEESGPVVFGDIGTPEAERRLRSAHNIAIGVALTLSALPEPPPGERPPYSYNQLVQIAIWQSPERRLTLQEIYAAISGRFPYYRQADEELKKKWQGSIRHMLSNRDAFLRLRDTAHTGRGDYWELNFAGLDESRRKRRKKETKRGQSPQKKGTRTVRTKEEGVEEELEFDPGRSASSLALPSASASSSEALASSFSVSLAGSVDRTRRSRPARARSATPRLSIGRARPSSSSAHRESPPVPPGETSGPVFLHPAPGGSYSSTSGRLETTPTSQAFDMTLNPFPPPRRPLTFPSLSGLPYDPAAQVGSFYPFSSSPVEGPIIPGQPTTEEVLALLEDSLHSQPESSSDTKGKGRAD
ncbi:hypothetical protein V5O48_005241 [Marasmius crinis-equi]|uniref:Fork-head domain-containing protein n=1 Tax=Marasmius crinis-equi TaxID=585013 RepID=A0ABR3FMU9_9AGAR